MGAGSPEEGTGILIGMLPMRLAVPRERKRLPRSVDDDDHRRVAQQALDWQKVGGSALLWEMGSATQGAEEGRAYAFAGRVAAAGEQLALAHAAAVEVALWREIRKKHDEPDPSHEMCMRAMAESQSLFVIGTGHALAYVALRALALDTAMRNDLIAKFSRGSGASPTFDPFSEEPRDWVSMNADTARKIGGVARSNGTQEVTDLIEPVVSFGKGRAWRDLVDRRGEDFHRWRPQSHGIAGVSRKNPWRREGRTRSLGIGYPVYEEARGLAEETAQLGTEAMVQLALAMETFMDRWLAASGRLGGPRFELG